MRTHVDQLTFLQADSNIGAWILPVLAVTLIALAIIVFVFVRRRNVEAVAVKSTVSPTTGASSRVNLPSPAEHAPARPDSDQLRALLAFAHALLGATTTGDVKAAITSHLVPMLGSRRVWLSSHIRGRRNVIVADPPGRVTRELLNVAGQDWMTFPLRVDRAMVGLLGVESGGGLRPHVRQFLKLAAPLIARALNTADQFESLREASLVDLLTGTSTRREGLTRLDAEIKRAQRTGSAMAVLMLDLDRFKSINDRFGHAVGDAVLVEVGRILRRTLRASDCRSRWGGEEFLVVLPDTDLSRAQIVAAGLLRNIASATVPGPAGPVGCTVSIGVTITRPGEADIERIVRRADIALYRAKEAGRGCIRVVLGDRSGNPIGYRSDDEGPKPPSPGPRGVALPFPDRRDPSRRDRRSVPSPGRRSTDPRPIDEGRLLASAAGKSAWPSLR
jgi:diguanylate cyclase (GGDEF)-like protein